VSLIWLAPAGVLVLGAVAVVVAGLRLLRRAERLRVSLSRLAELRVPLERMAEDLRVTGDTLAELRRR
jgi:cytochrome c-type biogenesis protein CcmH/NrfF